MFDDLHEASSQALVDLILQELDSDSRLQQALQAGNLQDIEVELRSFLEDEVSHFPEDLAELSAVAGRVKGGHSSLQKPSCATCQWNNLRKHSLSTHSR